MVIVKAILEIEDGETQEADILIDNLEEKDVILMLEEDDVSLADLISDELGYCVSEIIGCKSPDYVISSPNHNPQSLIEKVSEKFDMPQE